MALLAITLTAGTAAAVIGEAIRRRLNLLAYRRPDEAARPDPGRRWWVPVATAAAVIALTVRFLPTRPHLLWMLVPLALAGPWLAAVDLDVRRLPDRVLLPLLAWQALVTAGLFITGHRDTGLAVVIGAVGCLIGLWSLHWFSDGAVGFGDVKPGAAVAAATSAVSLTVLSWALLGSFTAAAIWALLARRQDLALGPWLALGGIGRHRHDVLDQALPATGDQPGRSGWFACRDQRSSHKRPSTAAISPTLCTPGVSTERLMANRASLWTSNQLAAGQPIRTTCLPSLSCPDSLGQGCQPSS